MMVSEEDIQDLMDEYDVKKSSIRYLMAVKGVMTKEMLRIELENKSERKGEI